MPILYFLASKSSTNATALHSGAWLAKQQEQF